MSSEHSDALAQIAELEAQREKAREELELARTIQYAKDLQRLVELEEEHGQNGVLKINLAKVWKKDKGAATLAVVKLPEDKDKLFRRFEVAAAKSKSGDETLKAGHLLAESCLVYPSKKDEPDLYTATINLAPGVFSLIANGIAERVQGSKDEGKGN
jgi:hypothetical protein